MPKLRTATPAETQAIADAVRLLRTARDKLKTGKVRPKLIDDVRTIIARGEGAHRHALRARLAGPAANQGGAALTDDRGHVFGVLDVSTAHISRAGADVLESGAHDIAAVYTDPFGWWIYADHDPESVYATVEGLLGVMQRAKSLGCRYVRLDTDGPELSGLPAWEW